MLFVNSTVRLKYPVLKFTKIDTRDYFNVGSVVGPGVSRPPNGPRPSGRRFPRRKVPTFQPRPTTVLPSREVRQERCRTNPQECCTTGRREVSFARFSRPIFVVVENARSEPQCLVIKV